MKLQSVVFASDCCHWWGLCLRLEGEAEPREDGLRLEAGASLRTDTYMNAFALGQWARVTGPLDWRLELRLRGDCRAALWRVLNDVREEMAELTTRGEELRTVVLRPPAGAPAAGVYYFRLEALGPVELLSGEYVTDEPVRRPDTAMGLTICTYRRREQVEKNAEKLKATRFFRPEDELFGKLRVEIVDNGSELPEEDAPLFRVFHNPNTGGSGGFTRGLTEFRRRLASEPLSHVVFMDDDVEFLPETFYRLYALLAYRLEAADDTVVAGRMFHLDNRHKQFTAAEIWNGGDILHIGFHWDMTPEGIMELMNQAEGAEYGGWWFCCFPMAFAAREDPLPFFLHCDDVEYGLRHGGTPLILNGIQVWHESPDFRKTAWVVYYDTRNPLVVNAIHHPELMDPEAAYQAWFQRITRAHLEEEPLLENMQIRAMWDFLKGPGFLRRGNPERLHRRLRAKKDVSRFENRLLWRAARLLFPLRFGRAVREYQALNAKRRLPDG